MQISDLHKGSNQVFSRSLHERDLEIGRLRRESEKLKRDQALTAGVVSLELWVRAGSSLGLAVDKEQALAKLYRQQNLPSGL